MIDWISASIPLRHMPIKAGHFLLFDEDGQILSDKPISKVFKGSFESKISLRSQGAIDEQGYCDCIFINGNPAKFLQGHNVFGSDDLLGLLRGLFTELMKVSDLGIDALQIMCSVNAATISRIDFTKSIMFENRLQARSYIKELSMIAHTRNGRPNQKGWTLAFQATSKRWSVIVYTKGDELATHKPNEKFQHTEYIEKQADNLVRVELRLRTLELMRQNCRKAQQLTPSKLHQMYADFIGRIQMTTTVNVTSEEISKLTRAHQATYLLWKNGVNVQAEMTERTYFRHLSAIKKIGVDITYPYQESSLSNVVPLKMTIKGKSYQIPEEAYQKGLVFQPQLLRVV